MYPSIQLHYYRGGHRISIKGALITVTRAKKLKPHPRPLNHAHLRLFPAKKRAKSESKTIRICSKGKLQQESFSTWLEWGLDFVHIHYFLNRVLAKRGARTSPSSPPGSATVTSLYKYNSLHCLYYLCLPNCIVYINKVTSCTEWAIPVNGDTPLLRKI